MRGKRYEREQEVIEKNKQGIGGREKESEKMSLGELYGEVS